MKPFETLRVKDAPTVTAPDGATVRILATLKGGSTAIFELPPGEVSEAMVHRTVEEVWLFLAGRGEMWRRQGDREEVVAAERGVCLTIPLGTHFQFRSLGPETLVAAAVTMPPWPGEGEAVRVPARWPATVPRK